MMELTRQRAVGESRRPSPQKQKEEIEHADLQASRAGCSRLRRARFDRCLWRRWRRLRGDGGRVAPSRTRHDASLGVGRSASHGRRFYVRSSAATGVGGPNGNRDRLGRGSGQIVEESAEALGQLFQSLADRWRLPGVFLLAVRQAVLPARFSKYRPGPRSGRYRPTKKPPHDDVP